MIKGVGVDMVAAARFRAAMDRRGEGLLERLFTPGELDYCMGKRSPEVHLAARFAAKSSLFKALGRTLGFKNVEVERLEGGRPAFRCAVLPDGVRLSLSITHTLEYSMAVTVVEG